MPSSKPPKPPKGETEDEAVIMERMERALKKMMSTPPETHEDMVKRRRGEKKPSPAQPRAKRPA